MAKYTISYEIEEIEGCIFEYETDMEPPRIGEIVNLMDITDDKVRDLYRVKEVWRNPLSPEKENILITLENYQ